MGIRRIALLVCSLSIMAFAAQAEEPQDLKAAMEENNSKWLAAYNDQDAETLGDMYTDDALLIAAGSQPIRGAKDIEAYWAADVRDYGDHTWEILDAHGEGGLAYQTAVWTAAERAGGQKYTGNTVRILERQPDGQWLTKVHMFSVHE